MALLVRCFRDVTVRRQYVLLYRSVFREYNVRALEVDLEADSQRLRNNVVYETQIFSLDVIPQFVQSEHRVVDVASVEFEEVYYFHHSEL